MGGLYIHIPFCRKACRYCDFYFTVSLTRQEEFIGRLMAELEQKAAFPHDTLMGSLYLGGGTPSLLSPENLRKIMESVHQHYSLSDDAEVTIECNPEDLDAFYLKHLRDIGINRISIGIQSFSDEELQLMRRSHHSTRAYSCVNAAAAAGFENITIDLIYGIPGQTPAGWEKNIHRALSLPVTHISAYHLTFEPGTVFDHWRKKGRLSPVQEEESVLMYKILRKTLTDSGFQHYEISNFAKKEKKSRHNQLYWSGEPYLGFGPSAHSFDGTFRSWNVASLKRYIESASGELPPGESERLSLKEKYHDYLITALRTDRGVDPQYIVQNFGEEVMEYFNKKAHFFLTKGSLQEKNGRLAIEPEQWLVADHITRKLFMD